MRLLVVEDEGGIASALRQGLAESGYAVDVARDGSEGRDYALAAGYDVILLDILLPKLDGLALLGELRRRGMTTPVLQAGNRLVTGDLAMDLGARTVTRGEQAITLTPREFAVLEYFLRHPGQALSRA